MVVNLKDILPGQINKHLRLEWAEEHQIAILYANSIKREVVDAWADKMQEIMFAWPKNKILLTLHDYSEIENFVTTPHLRRRSRENVMLRPDLNARTAVVLPDSFVIRMTAVFLRALPQPHKSSRQRRIFTSYEQAMDWLKEALDET